MRCHEVEYEILGSELQLVEIEIDEGETVIAEAGAMAYTDDGITFEAKMGDGSQPDQGFFGKIASAGKRMLAGETLFMTHFTNTAGGNKPVGFAAPYPGKIIAINMAEAGEEVLCQKDAFLCAALGTQIGIAFTERASAGFFGGEGFILQKLEGDGMCFIQAGGTVIEKDLQGEKLLVDTGCVVGFTNGIEYKIEKAGSGFKTMMFGGEGLFLATLSGHGKVWVQSMPFSNLVARIHQLLPEPPSRDD